MKRIILSLSLILVCIGALAQIPQGITHQAVIRDASNLVVANSTIGIKVNIIQGSPEGTVVYSETHSPISNASGLITYVIGQGTVISGVFADIDWSDGPYFLKTEADPTGGTNYSIEGTTQFHSVPFAYHAKTSTSFLGLGDLIIPVLTSVEILQLEPHEGQTVYNTDEKLIQVYDGTNWSSFKMDCWPQPTIANAGPNQTITDSRVSATMAANTPEPNHGVGQWSILSGEGGSFDDDTKPDAVFTGQPCTSYQLKWTITTACGSSNSNVNITFNHTPTTAYAGDDQSFYDNTTSTTLAANTPTEGTGQWSIISGDGGSFDDDSKPDAVFTGQPCTSYQLRWTITTVCSSSSSNLTVTFNHTPTTANAGVDQNFSDGTTSTTLVANTPTEGAGQWSIVSGDGGSFDDETKPDAVFAGQFNSMYTLQWKISTQCNTSVDLVKIYFIMPSEPVTDIDGNIYKTVWIGDQLWMAENLRTTRDSQGNPVTRYCNNNDPYCELYGGLYDWETVMNGTASSENNPSGVKGICPTGWHVPSDDEWTQLVNYVVAQGYLNEPGNALKSCRQVNSPLGGDCNTSNHPRWNRDSEFHQHGFDKFGFSALPGGIRGVYGFTEGGVFGGWWSATEYSSTNAWLRYMLYYSGDVSRHSGNVGTNNKAVGYSVRCVRD